MEPTQGLPQNCDRELHMLARQLSFGNVEKATLAAKHFPNGRLDSLRPKPLDMYESPVSVLDAAGGDIFDSNSSPLEVPFTLFKGQSSRQYAPNERTPTLARRPHERSQPIPTPDGKATPSCKPSRPANAASTPHSNASWGRCQTPQNFEVGSPSAHAGPSDRDCSTPTTPSEYSSGFSSGYGFTGGSHPSSQGLTPCPATPFRGGSTVRSKLRRMNSGLNNLEKTKILLTTKLKRTESINQPSLFKFNEHFDYERIIGRSQHSEVWEVVRKTDKQERTAIKRSIRPFVSASDRDKKMHEVEMVTTLGKHPHIVQYYRCWQQDAVFNTQMELCKGGSLSTCQITFPQLKLPTDLTWRIAHEVATGLSHIHKSGMLHLDIKPENIFLDIPDTNTCTFKIGDFGLAVLVSERNWEDGDGKYVAPELLCDDTDATSAADIYSFGATLYECVTGTNLQRGPNGCQTVFPLEVPLDLRKLIDWMLETDPRKRPTADDILAEVAPHYHPSPVRLPYPASPEFNTYDGSNCSSPSCGSPRSAFREEDSQESFQGFGSPMCEDDVQGVQRLSFDWERSQRVREDDIYTQVISPNSNMDAIWSNMDEVSPIRMLSRMSSCTPVPEGGPLPNDEAMASPAKHWMKVEM